MIPPAIERRQNSPTENFRLTHHPTRRNADEPQRIFIVEDEAFIAMELEDRLRQSGYLVCGTAAQGELVAERVDMLKPDLVLLDIKLAGNVSGIEVARNLARLGNVPVVFLTAYSDAEYIARAAEYGAYGYLVKPFSENELHATIQLALAKHLVHDDLQQTNAELEERVRTKTQEREQALQRAKEADQAKTKILHNVHHELRTPLQQITGLTTLLRDMPVLKHDPEAAKWLEHLWHSSDALCQLVERVLDLKELDSTAFPLEMTSLSVWDVLDEAIHLVRPIATAAGITVNTKTPRDSKLRVTANRDRLRQALVNLLSNAVIYNRPLGSVHIDARATPDGVIISIADTGIGMTPEQVEKAFDTFARFVPKGRVIGGIGIGLTVAKQVVERMGGRIEVATEPRVGSTFSVIF